MNVFNIFSSDISVRKLVQICRGDHVPGHQRRAELYVAVKSCIDLGHDVRVVFDVVSQCFTDRQDNFGFDIRLARLFANRGIPPNTRCIYNGVKDSTILHAMAHGATVTQLERYLEKAFTGDDKISFDAVDQYKRTALSVATTLGHDSWWRKCQLLMNAGFSTAVELSSTSSQTVGNKIASRMHTVKMTEMEKLAFRNTLGRAIAREFGWLCDSNEAPDWMTKVPTKRVNKKRTTLMVGSKVSMFSKELACWCPATVKKMGGGFAWVEYRYAANDYRTKKMSARHFTLRPAETY